MIFLNKTHLWILCFVFVTSSISSQKNMLVIGHRGAMGHETENSLPSIQKAMNMEVDMIEIDVFKIASGEIVVFHDEKIDRLTDGKGSLETLNLQEVKALTLEGNHKIPLLNEVLDLIDHKVSLNIELKGADTAKEVNFIISKYIQENGWSAEDFIISSFNWQELEIMRQLNQDISIAVLTEENPLDAIPMAKKLNATAINPYYKTLKKESVGHIQKLGFKVFTYTVNRPKDIKKMRKFGVDGIFTNYPERAK
ncbi:MAG: glycerophosphodiester phosphodiesterase family protein [Eudoraea sp.]|uniref:glycerophosphodiester phosphodiesterase n=1 Tax=Eudoraea sp. TaxID=1979955 RepID=UPI003C708B93